jgi:hypothetical protein
MSLFADGLSAKFGLKAILRNSNGDFLPIHHLQVHFSDGGEQSLRSCPTLSLASWPTLSR